MDRYLQVADRLSKSSRAVALTGAGISVESGIPDFRSADGLWSRFDPMEFGHIESFRTNPAKVWKMLMEMDRLLQNACPNAAHLALADLERRGILRAIVTQNVDSLHQKAGSRNVVEFHGHGRTLRCDCCLRRFPREAISEVMVPPLCTCGEPLRPDFVFFGEEIPPQAHQEAITAVHACDVMLVVGTSATVAPASHLPFAAKEAGAFLVEINPTTTDLTHRLTDLHVKETAGRALPAIVKALEGMDLKRKLN